MDESPARKLCDHLRHIVTLLEKGESVPACVAVSEMEASLSSMPSEMPEADLAEARRLLDRYAVLEAELREHTLASLRHLGAVQRSLAYRGRRPHP